LDDGLVIKDAERQGLLEDEATFEVEFDSHCAKSSRVKDLAA